MPFTLGGLAPASQLDHSAEDGISSREFIGIIVVYYSAYLIHFMQPEHTRHLLGSNINDCFFIFSFKELTALTPVSTQKILGLQHSIKHVILLLQALIQIIDLLEFSCTELTGATGSAT